MELLLPGLGLLFWTLIAFLVVFFLLKSFAWKPILATLKERETGIADAIASADKVKAEMALLKKEPKVKIVKEYIKEYIPVDRPYPVPVAQPYPVQVPVEVPVQVPVPVHVPGKI